MSPNVVPAVLTLPLAGLLREPQSTAVEENIHHVGLPDSCYSLIKTYVDR